MVKAYHFVSGGDEAVRHILGNGFLLPAIERMPEDAVDHRCGEWLREMRDGGDAIPRAVAAMDKLYEERLAWLRISRKDDDPSFETSYLNCEDFLAGDFDNVFFSLGDWITEEAETSEFKPNGFVFDAKRLVQAGARIRTFDFLEIYEERMHEFLYYPDGKKGWKVLDGILKRAQKEEELRGKDALLYLEQDQLEPGSELVFDGRVAVAWSSEMWEDGEVTIFHKRT